MVHDVSLLPSVGFQYLDSNFASPSSSILCALGQFVEQDDFLPIRDCLPRDTVVLEDTTQSAQHVWPGLGIGPSTFSPRSGTVGRRTSCLAQMGQRRGRCGQPIARMPLSVPRLAGEVLGEGGTCRSAAKGVPPTNFTHGLFSKLLEES